MSTNGLPFRVSMSGLLAQEIKRLAKIAGSKGIKSEFLSSLAAIHQKLCGNQLDFREHRYQSQDQRFDCRGGAIRPVAVHYAVHEELRTVILVKVFLMGA